MNQTVDSQLHVLHQGILLYFDQFCYIYCFFYEKQNFCNTFCNILKMYPIFSNFCGLQAKHGKNIK